MCWWLGRGWAEKWAWKIGHIEVEDDISSIEVSKEYIPDIVDAFKNGKIKGEDVSIING